MYMRVPQLPLMYMFAIASVDLTLSIQDVCSGAELLPYSILGCNCWFLECNIAIACCTGLNCPCSHVDQLDSSFVQAAHAANQQI